MERGKTVSAPFLQEPLAGMTVNEGQTAFLKCTADGHPLPRVTWSKTNSSLPEGRHMVESNGTLILKNVESEDDGVYSCRAENLLGSVNASAKLTVQCKFCMSQLACILHETSFSRTHNINSLRCLTFKSEASTSKGQQ